LSARLAVRAAATDFGEPRIDRLDGDTLTLATKSIEGYDAPPAGLGLSVLAGECDGLAVEIRFTARDGRGRGGSTLVLAGEVRGESFFLKAIWRVGTTSGEDTMAQFARWANESAFLTALDEFRASNQIPRKFARRVFPPRGADRLGALVASLLVVPLGKPRLAALFLRVMIFAVLFVALGAGGYWAWDSGHSLWFFPLGLLVLIFSWLLWQFVKIERHFWCNGWAQFRAMYSKLNDESPKLVPATSIEQSGAASDAYIRKYTAELIAAGFIPLGDVRFEPVIAGELAGRIFAAPDGTTYLGALFQSTNRFDPVKEYRYWPAAVSFVCHTYLTGGGYAASMNGPRHGYRRKRTGPECLSRVFPDEHDPIEFAQLHAEAVAKFVAETGNAAQRHLRFEEYLRRQNALWLLSDMPSYQ
jgi:hypothetical protein